MSGFKSSLILERAIGFDQWKLAAPLIYRSDLVNLEIEVPAGFVTDFASIPRFFHRLLPHNGEYDAPAVVHDYLYASGAFPQETCDLVFLEAMESIHVLKWKRAAMFRAVRLFGWIAFAKHRENQSRQ